jgi:hypothetical protein
MIKNDNKICGNCLNIIDSIDLELKSLELIEDSLSKLADEAIKSVNGVVVIDEHYLEVISTSLYNSLIHIKEIVA